MNTTDHQLLQFIKDRAFKTGETYQLASGDTSSYYIDARMTAVFSDSAKLIGEVLYERTKDLGADAIGGLEVGAVPLTTAAVIAYAAHGKKMEGFWVRDKTKDHGTRKLIEGKLLPGSRVVIVDDVVTRGTSVTKAVEAVRAIGCQVISVIVLVDRLVGARKHFDENQIANYQPIFTIRDLGVKVDEHPPAEVATR